MRITQTSSVADPLEGAARLSVATSVVVLALKLVAWRVTGSVALGSDALESIINVVAALAMWVALRVARRPPDADHPFGHGKAEYLSAVFEGALVLIAAAAIAREAWPRVLHPVPARSLGEGAAWSIAATACNAALGWFLVRRGRRLRSPALEADGVHVLSDVATSVGVLVGIAGAVLTGWWILDALLAMLVAAQILRAGWRLVRRAVGGLMDETLDPAEVTALRGIFARVIAAHAAVEVRDVRTRSAGARAFCDLRMTVPGAMTVDAAHALCDEIERAVGAEHPYVEVVIHVEPAVASRETL